MKRHRYQPRPDWRAKVETVGLTFHSHDNGPYWDESAGYELTRAEVDELEAAANTLHFLCIDAAEAVIKNNWWARLGIPEAAVPCILRSWERDDFSLYGRFDFSFDGVRRRSCWSTTPTRRPLWSRPPWRNGSGSRNCIRARTSSTPSTNASSRPGGAGAARSSTSAASRRTGRG